ncbi:uncharacterized protein MELLADRAFT_104299 [Melampsora larici-populina 98AG31]|uniref:Uncharacterized protein n=1 Tax=Melampsora larici-populina (strain 98AG31 / pathotype 3-4-7) TaxID=747676 RepID=F4RE91_MELLP|nr:uncharacterized protein MELLADRAFT_104299 [Melampsora larici-populina 98AG31]EGG09051.1 hypothetical protein MELLADRAFT_104299 [Melampsora larici-populina 98AG31]
MTKTESTVARAIRASRRVQGLEVDNASQTGQTQPEAGPSSSMQESAQTSTALVNDIVNSNNPVNQEPKRQLRNPVTPQQHLQKFIELEPHPLWNFIGHVPIPLPFPTTSSLEANIRQPKESVQNSSSDQDDPHNDFIDSDNKSESERSDSDDSEKTEEEKKSRLHKSSPSLGSSNSNKESGGNSSDSSSVSNSDSENSDSGSESGSSSDDSDRQGEKGEKSELQCELE